MGDMERPSPAAFTRGDSPWELPMTKLTAPGDCMAPASRLARPGESTAFPSMHRGYTFPAAWRRICSSSFSRAASISPGEGSLDKRASGSSMSSHLHRGRRRFSYSATASRQ